MLLYRCPDCLADRTDLVVVHPTRGVQIGTGSRVGSTVAAGLPGRLVHGAVVARVGPADNVLVAVRATPIVNVYLAHLAGFCPSGPPNECMGGGVAVAFEMGFASLPLLVGGFRAGPTKYAGIALRLLGNADIDAELMIATF